MLLHAKRPLVNPNVKKLMEAKTWFMCAREHLENRSLSYQTQDQTLCTLTQAVEYRTIQCVQPGLEQMSKYVCSYGWNHAYSRLMCLVLCTCVKDEECSFFVLFGQKFHNILVLKNTRLVHLSLALYSGFRNRQRWLTLFNQSRLISGSVSSYWLLFKGRCVFPAPS